MRVWKWVGILTAAAGCAGTGSAARIEALAAEHQQRAVRLEAAGNSEAALREREAAATIRDQLVSPPDDALAIPPLSAL